MIAGNALASFMHAMSMTYSGPICDAWQRDSDVVCEHESCWAIMSDGGNYAFLAACDAAGLANKPQPQKRSFYHAATNRWAAICDKLITRIMGGRKQPDGRSQ